MDKKYQILNILYFLKRIDNSVVNSIHNHLVNWMQGFQKHGFTRKPWYVRSLCLVILCKRYVSLAETYAVKSSASLQRKITLTSFQITPCFITAVSSAGNKWGIYLPTPTPGHLERGTKLWRASVKLSSRYDSVTLLLNA